MAPTPLIGLQYYWSFLIAGTSLLIYLAARNLTSLTNPLNGILAVALLFTTGAITDTAGMPLVDITAMFMVLLVIIVFIFSSKRDHQSRVLIIALGFLYFLSIKTKETAMPVGIIFLGLGYFAHNRFNWKILYKNLLFILVGVISGIILFLLLNMIFLGDPLFGFRPIEIQKFLLTYVGDSQSNEKYTGFANWFTSYFLNGLWIPFLLYLVSGSKAAINPFLKKSNLLVWLLPLAVILFATFTVGNQWGFQPRFIFPAIPIICLLGPQFLNFDLRSVHDRRQRNTALTTFFFGLLTMLLIRIFMRHSFQIKGWDVTTFMSAVLIPVLFSVILAFVFLWKKLSITISYLIAVLIIAISVIPISHNIKQIAIAQPNRIFSENLFYPFSAFSNRIRYTSNMKFLISPDVWREMDVSYFAKDRVEISSLFNVFFDSYSTKDNFAIPAGLIEIPDKLLDDTYSYALLSLDDWHEISGSPKDKLLLEQRYSVFVDEQDRIVLLKPNNNDNYEFESGER
jgi:hypothetical protein